jgi:hypothetical protein
MVQLSEMDEKVSFKLEGKLRMEVFSGLCNKTFNACHLLLFYRKDFDNGTVRFARSIYSGQHL